MNFPSRLLVPFVIVFVCIFIVILAGWKFFSSYGIDNYVLIAANTLFFLVSILVFFIQKKALKNANPNVFIRSIMSGMMVKMFFCIVAVLIYTLVTGDGFNKKAVFISMFFYLIYLAAEVKVLMKLNKQHNA